MSCTEAAVSFRLYPPGFPLWSCGLTHSVLFPNKKTDVRNSLALDIFILDECNPGSVYTPSHGGEGTGEPLADSVILRLREQLLWHPTHTHTRCFLSLAV